MSSSGRRRVARRVVPALLIVLVAWSVAPVPIFLWLRFADLPATSFQIQDLARGDGPDGQPAETHVRTMDIEDISRAMIAVTVANEDGRLGNRRGGVNWEEQWERVGDQESSGSSVPQQYIKNLLLFRYKTPARKGIEAIWAELFAYIVPPRRQLELYLNSVEFGPGIWGVCEASWRLVGKSPSDLTFTEAVSLLQQLPDPKHRTYTPLAEVPVTLDRVQGHGGAAAISARFGIRDLADDQTDPTCATPDSGEPLGMTPSVSALISFVGLLWAAALAVTVGAIAWVFGWNPRWPRRRQPLPPARPPGPPGPVAPGSSPIPGHPPYSGSVPPTYPRRPG